MSSIDFSCIIYNAGVKAVGSTQIVQYVYPIQFIGTITVTFGEDLTFSSNSNYFTIQNSSDDVSIDGASYTVTISGVTGYLGLISSRSDNTSVTNISVLSINNSTLGDRSGWLGQGGPGNGFLGTVVNCNSDGNIGAVGSSNTGCGGLIGGSAGNGGTCIVSNCYTTGDILNSGSGGLVGISAGYNSGSGGYCEIKNSFSTGNINRSSCGGIVGQNAGILGECKIINCYSIGNINSSDCGGIAGPNAGCGFLGVAGSGTCNIIDCFSTGNITTNSTFSGGIVGKYAGYLGYCKIDGCYSRGVIGAGYSGGIAGTIGPIPGGISSELPYSGTCIINNCYSTGTISGIYTGDAAAENSKAGGILAPNITGTVTNCYACGTITNGLTGNGIVGSYSGATVTNCTYNNGWTDATASSTTGGVTSGLLNPTVDSVWKQVQTDFPWKINYFLIGATAVYDQAKSTLTYVSPYPINNYNGLTTPVVSVSLPTIGFGGFLVDSNTANVVVFSFVQPIENNTPMKLVLFSNSTVYDYLDSLLVDYSSTTTTTTTTTTTIPPTTTSTTTVPATTTTTTTINPNNDIIITQSYVDSTTFPVTISDGTATKQRTITLTENIVTNKQIRFIFPSGSYITFEGSGNTITIDSVNDYVGLIDSKSTNTIVLNLGVLSTNSTLATRAGWIGSDYFAGKIDNCYSTGAISDSSGGIVGEYAGFGGVCNITNCYSTGNISGGYGGGIAGAFAGAYGPCNISNCYSTGAAHGQGAGGIAGSYAGAAGGVCNITSCYRLTGQNEGPDSGCIAGSSSGTGGVCNISNCYSITSNYRLAGIGSKITTNTNNNNTPNWNDSVAGKTLDQNAFFKVSPTSIERPWKLIAFLYTAVASLTESGSNLSYTNIWPFSGIVNPQNTYLVDNSGNRVSFGQVTSTDRQLNIAGVSISSTMSYYSLVVNGEYIDRFLLVGNLVVRVRIIADYFQIISDKSVYETFKDAVRVAIASALGISLFRVNVLNLSPGSVLAELDISPELIDQLQSIVKSGNLSVEFNGITYPADPNYFEIIDNTCFHKDTLILTPSGSRKVQDLSRGDLVKTAQGREVPVIRISSFIGSREKCPLYVMYKDTLAPNVPLQDLYMSEGHAFYNNGKWRHMKCSELTTKLELDNMAYYNIVVDNYMENTLVANGVEVESLFDMKGLKMHWRCEEKCCKPVIERVNSKEL